MARFLTISSKSGDAVYYDSTQPHLVKSATKSKARILAVLYTGAK